MSHGSIYQTKRLAAIHCKALYSITCNNQNELSNDLKGELHPNEKLSMFCVLSQNEQHCLEK